MKWIKKGLIFNPKNKMSWAKDSALQPVPYFIKEDVIRVYAGFRDEKGVSRVGFVDLDANNPSNVLEISRKPVLNIGIPGAFDDNGVVPCAVVKNDKKVYMYYAGYKLGEKVRMTIFSGLAISEDNGKSFERYSNVPVFERTNSEVLFRVIHSIILENGRWRVWYGGGSQFKQGKYKTLPMYDIRYTESEDGVHFNRTGKVILPTQGQEYRVARPYIIKDAGIYKMFFCAGSENVTYKLGYAESIDGISWIRKDEELGMELSKNGWDSLMMAYPSVVKYKDKVYLFYNGNNYGKDGFGYAELVK
ncbi:hypothetical protein ACFIJ5_09950 [Haloimpatiens sp. FM7330]|uniref:hypothetical protein n=1 Tax=Haloimpatiens sp. FM7330 TaxID=3298610 RepID=UPI00364547D7